MSQQRYRHENFKDRNNDPLLAKVAETKSPLLLGGRLSAIQLLTRRPIVLDVPAIDGMVYVPEAGPLIYPVMKEVYGIDLLKENTGQMSLGEVLDPQPFQSRSVEEWMRLAEKYQFTEVLVRQGYDLRLPLLMQQDFYKLYRIPSVLEDRNQKTENRK